MAHLRPDPAGVVADAGAAAAVSRRLAGTGRGRPAAARRHELEEHLALSTTDAVWSAQDTGPAVIEEALRRLVAECHAQIEHCVPARTLNLVCVVDREWSGEIANRLRRVGRYHASRTVVCAVERGRRTIDATATISTEGSPRPGEFAVMRELGLPDRSSLLLARPFLDGRSSPSRRVADADLVRRVREALAELSEPDREVLLMRNLEELPYREIGCNLDMDPAAARKRYGRALLRLRKVLLDAGLLEDSP